MRRLTTLLALVSAAAVTFSVMANRDKGTAVTSDARATASHAKSASTSGIKSGTKSGTPKGVADNAISTQQVGDTTGDSTFSRPGAVQITPGGALVVYRLGAAAATVTGKKIVFSAPARSLVSTTGAGRKLTSAFVTAWAGDTFASTLRGVILTSDGVRHAVSLSYPALSGGRLSFDVDAATTVPKGLAAETGIVTTGGVSGISGMLQHPTLFLALAAARTVHGCQLVSGSTCDGLDLAQTSMEKVDLVRSSLVAANLWQAGLHGATLTGADVSRASAYRADLSAVSARRLVARGLRFTQGSADHADFTGSDFSRAVLRRTDLSYSRFAGALLRAVKASGAYAKHTDFTGADLSGAQLMSADLTGANFRNADLRGADLAGANLTGADFTGADLTGANLNDAIVTGAAFSHVSWGATKCVDGIVRNACVA